MSSLDPAAFLGIALVGAGGPGAVIALSVVLVGALEGDCDVSSPRGPRLSWKSCDMQVQEEANLPQLLSSYMYTCRISITHTIKNWRVPFGTVAQATPGLV